jgi:small subunit ribosomal protein S16
MATVIRLARGGAKKRPFYRVVVTDNRAPRDGDFIERLGTFDPLLPKDGKRLTVNEERAKYWLAQGAKPSDRVMKLFADAALVAKPDYTGKPVKTRKKADKLSRAEKRAAAEAEAKAQQAAEAAAPAVEAPAEAEAPAA